jgi:hypothetical protein
LERGNNATIFAFERHHVLTCAHLHLPPVDAEHLKVLHAGFVRKDMSDVVVVSDLCVCPTLCSARPSARDVLDVVHAAVSPPSLLSSHLLEKRCGVPHPSLLSF